MANDTISRKAAIDALDAICDRECEYPKKQRAVMCGACHLGSAFDAIDELPSAERHGRWVKKYRGNYLCSVCGAWYRTTDDYGNIIDGEMTANYCESCGAKMDEVETNETCTSRRSE